jgi:plastocyanin
MTQRTKSLAILMAAIPLIALSITLLNPAHARGDAKPQTAEVRVDNFTFGPQSLTVPVNTTVTWVNRDDIPHVIVSNDGVFKSKALDTDDKFSFTFTKAGTYPYFCGIHPKMVGKIVVQ